VREIEHTQQARRQGRTIAPACSHLGADWLERADREAREQPERALDLLRVDFAFVESIEELRDQRIVIFTRDDVVPQSRFLGQVTSEALVGAIPAARPR
jgi:hypothetical protein